ncbi:hypothetical protein OKJ48_09075 [Streptomyces kunmingensis]|uniref:Uncharacterized protein n=1 Tax=Streptomyces kunmingensis TaxID=68225 RepID=A0ABU6C6Q7_9ACTN|nr:hypothetical protein [Streptomyces kunmingensis]MEB3960398.1 hypothetical protein [Streptomyces kunmingensis]
MKTTTMFLHLANPRRTTLAHLKDAEEIQAAPLLPEHTLELPTNTANPKRTILMEKPQQTVA